MNIYLVIVLIILIWEYLLNLVVENLNLKSASPVLPSEFTGSFDNEKYAQAQNYLRENTRFKLLKNGIFTALVLAFILSGGFNIFDYFARGFHYGPIVTGLIFAGSLMLVVQVINIPFSFYRTFVIEEKYGFNRTTVPTFILDILKGWLVSGAVGGIIFSLILWFFARAASLAWVYCWMALSLFQVFLIFIAPVVILPLFNKFIPLEDSPLKTAIQQYAQSQHFQLKGIFKMDASRRSTKSNAFFTGFGKFRRIALFDTLIERHDVDELVSILAHEIGHYQKRHIMKQLSAGICANVIMFFILSLFINNRQLFAAFGMEQTSIYASLFFFAFLYTPISMVFSVVLNVLARRHEYQADAFAIITYKRPQAFISALKKLSVANLSNLTPHPLKVFLDYSHPPVLKRIEAIRNIIGK